MSPNLSRWAMLVPVLLVLALIGCENRAGSWRGSNAATRIELTRQQDGQFSNRQTLKVELGTGVASFIDTDGRAYPAQVNADQLKTLRTATANGRWQNVKRQPPRSGAAVTAFDLKVFSANGKTAPGQASWTEPSAKPQPDVRVFEETFDSVARAVHPLSDDVDLLK